MSKRRLLPFSRPLTPLWQGPAPLCLAEHYDGKVRRLRLVLTKQSCLSQGEQNQFLNHAHPLHGSGLLFGYAADGFANPDWLIVSDTSHPGAWRLLHAVSKAGGSRFTVGSAVRYPPGKSDVANKARLYQFEALHKIYFYDAWRNEPIPNRENSSLLLPPAPGMLQDGCYWSPTAATSVDTQPPAASMPDSSLSPDDLDLISSDDQPSLLPSPDSTRSIQKSHDQPVSCSSQADEEGSPTQASEPAAPSAGTVTSSGGEEGTPAREISSCDSHKPDNEGGEDREEEAATDDSVVEQQEEQEVTSIWEVNDSSSECFQAHCEPGEGGRSQSATSPPSASPCAQTDEQQDAPHRSRKSGDRAC